MIILDIPESVRIHARILSAEIIKKYQGNRDSIRDGEGHYHAKIVELLIEKHFDSIPENTYDYDQIIIAQDGNHYKTENKVKQRNVPPKPYHLASVSLSNTNNNAKPVRNSMHPSMICILRTRRKIVYSARQPDKDSLFRFCGKQSGLTVYRSEKVER